MKKDGFVRVLNSEQRYDNSNKMLEKRNVGEGKA